MQASIETLTGLERKFTITVPKEDISEEVTQRLKELVGKVKIPGFRSNKVPFKIVKDRYEKRVWGEVLNDKIHPSFQEALEKNELKLAAPASVDLVQANPDEDLIYTATFEILPDIDLVELDSPEIEKVQAEVTDEDLEKMLGKLQEQHKEWDEVSRPVEKGDKVAIDFLGKIDNEPFEGGEAKDHEVVIGSGSLIGNFEESLIGHSTGEALEVPIQFPDDYHHAALAGKPAVFDVTIKKVFEGKLPTFDEAFLEKFNMKEQGLDAFKQEIKSNMVRELEKKVEHQNREKIFDALLQANQFEIPNAMVEKEIQNLRHEMYHRIFGHHHSDDEKIPDFPRELFEEDAKRRVRLGLLFEASMKRFELVADEESVNAKIDQLAASYEKPDEFRSWYRSKKEHMAELQGAVLEEKLAQKISEKARFTEKKMSYDEVMK
ncbi:MAG: trigger factor [Legionella sp.]|nr:trigger factor [Legionella sp.]